MWVELRTDQTQKKKIMNLNSKNKNYPNEVHREKRGKGMGGPLQWYDIHIIGVSEGKREEAKESI